MSEDSAKTSPFNSRLIAVTGVVVLWALIYLPCLGTLELKGEEGRRTLPAMAMIESGNWIVPSVGGETYLNKPPLLNWLIALAIQVAGVVNEWSVRLPSAISVLVLGLGALLLTWRFLGASGAWLTAVFTLTNITMIEQGRLAELEAVTIACFGLAFLVWFYGEVHSMRQVHWIGSGLLLGMGLMTKGPLPILSFFYLFVVAVLWKSGRLRELFSFGHLVGAILTWAPLLVWTFIMFQHLGTDNVVKVWARELAVRVAPKSFSWSYYADGVIRSVVSFLPWGLMMPFLWNKQVLAAIAEKDRIRLIAMRWAFVIGYLVVALLPGARPRYTMLLVIPLVVMLAWTLTIAGLPGTFLWWRRSLQGLVCLAGCAAPIAALLSHASIAGWLFAASIAIAAVLVFRALPRFSEVGGLASASAATTTLVFGCYVLVIVNLPDQLKWPERIKAHEIETVLPAGVRLYAVDAGYKRFLVHLGFRVRYLAELKGLPVERPVFVAAFATDDQVALAERPNAARILALPSTRGNMFEIWRLD